MRCVVPVCQRTERRHTGSTSRSEMPHIDGTADKAFEAFEAFESARRPVVITRLTQGWAAQSWTSLDSLTSALGSDALLHSREGDEVRLGAFVGCPTENAPYLFHFLGHEGAESALQRRVLAAFAVPKIFAPHRDLYEVARRRSEPRLEASQNPEYRWLVVGRHGSGSTLHVDPNGTSAWNALLAGTKRWTLLPWCRAAPSRKRAPM